MARRSLTDFSDFESKNPDGDEQKQETEPKKQESGDTQVKNEQENTQDTDVKVLRNPVTIDTDVISSFRAKKKPRMEDQFTRSTYFIRNNLLKTLDKMSKNEDRGFKTHFVNTAIEKLMLELGVEILKDED